MYRKALVALAVLTVAVGVLSPAVPAEQITVLKVVQTPLSDEDFCTLITGTYCGGEMPQTRITDRIAFDPRPIAWY